jgi:hypothetical protein
MGRCESSCARMVVSGSLGLTTLTWLRCGLARSHLNRRMTVGWSADLGRFEELRLSLYRSVVCSSSRNQLEVVSVVSSLSEQLEYASSVPQIIWMGRSSKGIFSDGDPNRRRPK